MITHAHIDHIGGAQKLKQATGAPVYMNPNDTELQTMLDVQATWLGTAHARARSRSTSRREGRRQAAGGRHRVPRAPHTGPHAGQHQPVDSLGGQAGRGRHAVPRQHRPHRPAGRRRPPDSAIDPRQAAAAAGRDGRDSRARRDRPRSAGRNSTILSCRGWHEGGRGSGRGAGRGRGGGSRARASRGRAKSCCGWRPAGCATPMSSSRAWRSSARRR